MPDFDIDFCYERRQEVIDYVIRKYGEDRIHQEQGVFLEHGYFVYLGEQPFWELMQEQEQNRETLSQEQGIGLY